MYELADEAFASSGFGWYEVELGDGAPSLPPQPRVLARNRLVGLWPGAHSHVDGLRWWNVKHPAAYAQRLAAGTSLQAAPDDAAGGDSEDVSCARGSPRASRCPS
jgi:oxygen-independent coproporphyrinogen-3 oxidase